VTLKQFKRKFKQNGVFFVEGSSRSEAGSLETTMYILGGPNTLLEMRFKENGHAEPWAAILKSGGQHHGRRALG